MTEGELNILLKDLDQLKETWMQWNRFLDQRRRYGRNLGSNGTTIPIIWKVTSLPMKKRNYVDFWQNGRKSRDA